MKHFLNIMAKSYRHLRNQQIKLFELGLNAPIVVTRVTQDQCGLFVIHTLLRASMSSYIPKQSYSNPPPLPLQKKIYWGWGCKKLLYILKNITIFIIPHSPHPIKRYLLLYQCIGKSFFKTMFTRDLSIYNI